MELTVDLKTRPPKPAGSQSPRTSCMDLIVDLKARLHRVEFKPQAGAGEGVLLEFSDPAPCKAVSSSMAVETLAEGPCGASYDVLQVLSVAREGKDESRWRKDLRSLMDSTGTGRPVPIVTVKVEDVLVFWRPGWATVQAPPQRMDVVLLALADFAYYEGQLRRIEDETAAAWADAEADLPVAHDAASVGAARRVELADHSAATFRRRMRHVRIEPHLYEPAAAMPPLAVQLGEALREEAGIEDRLEYLDGKLEVFESIYEMVSQRLADCTHNKQGLGVEWLIVGLLAAELILTIAGFVAEHVAH
jgi:hypothetical protein